MSDNPLKSLINYGRFIAAAVDRPAVEHSTIAVWSDSPYTGTAEGEVVFSGGIRLRLRQELDFDAGLIAAYGYEVYRGQERLFWYDDFPHPGDPTLASSYPHHKYVPPDIKHHRIPAPQMSFTRPNLSVLVEEIELLLKDVT